MKYNLLWILCAVVCILLGSCESENIEDKYYSGENGGSPTDTIVDSGFSEIVWLPLNGNLNDTTTGNTPLVMVGNPVYVDGINPDHGKGLYLDGSSYLLINLGYLDTLSIAFWIKGEAELQPANTPFLFDYGLNGVAAQLDATSGATSLTVMKNTETFNSKENSSVEYLNSFNRYSFVYVEAGGENLKVYFKGYASSGEEIIYINNFNLPGIIEAESDLLYIGRSAQRENITSSFFKGAIDEIHIFKKPLSNTEIENLALTPIF